MTPDPSCDQAYLAFLQKTPVINTVLRAEQGDSALFAWSLGLRHDEWCEMRRSHSPELDHIEPLRADRHEVVFDMAPPAFIHLRDSILDERNREAHTSRAKWLAGAIAAGCFESGHLWENLGLGSRHDLDELLSSYFPSVFLANTDRIRWKRFLLKRSLDEATTIALMKVNCRDCELFSSCIG